MYVWEKLDDLKYVVFWKRSFKHMPEHIHMREIAISGLDLLPCPWRYKLHIHFTSVGTWQYRSCGLFTAARVHVYWIMLLSYFVFETGSSRVFECLSENARPIHSSSVGRACLSYFSSFENFSLNHFNTSEVKMLSHMRQSQTHWFQLKIWMFSTPLVWLL